MQACHDAEASPSSSSTHVPGVGQATPWLGRCRCGVLMYKHKHRACIKLSPYPSSLPCVVVLCPVSIGSRLNPLYAVPLCWFVPLIRVAGSSHAG